ncbi:MAG: hypothetical protein KatS3mg053_1498 [Candidatus Roseilinea sp.]|nr:MAG: hypothetical protein KatS3mg053_1498 [Candidatus Roseilinea sp.]GIV84944.1 MAG: hypothetical protein KatS3mg052_1951 [Candidatus Roseilinea sp.]
MTVDQALIAALHLSLGCVFILAAVGKLRTWGTLRDAVERLTMHRLSGAAAQSAALGLPPAEFALGVGLLVGFWPALLPAMAGTLLGIFSVVIAAHLRRGNNLSCNCFGESSAAIGPSALVRNLILLGMALWMTGWAWAHPARTFTPVWLLGLGASELAGLLVVVVNLMMIVFALSEGSVVFVKPQV